MAHKGEKTAVQSFFKPSLATIIIFGTLSLLSLSAYLANAGPYIPLLYPLTYLFSIIQPIVHPIEISQPIYAGADEYAIFYTWILPPASIVFFYVLSCTLVWLWNRDKKGDKLLPVGAGAALLIGLFLILPLGVSAVARATGPPPPENINYVLQNNLESCEGLPAVLKGGEQDQVLTFQMEWNNSISTCVLNGQLASPRPANFKLVIDPDATMAITGNSSLRADVENEGTIVVGEGAILNMYGIMNNGVILVQQGGTLNNEGMISPRLGNIDSNLVLLGNASKIKIINEGELVNQETGYIENFGAIVNSGTLQNDGEIISFYDGSISNTHGGVIDNRPNGRISIASNGTVTNSGIGTLFSNFGRLSNGGAVNNSDGATLENIGYGSLINGGAIYNDRNATISNTSVSEFANNWKIYNGCTGIIDGIISGQPVESLCER